MNNFPVEIKKSIPSFIERFQIKNESRKIYPTIINNLGILPYVSAGNTSFLAWRTAIPPTIASNSWVQLTNAFEPPCGRKLVFTGTIEIETTAECVVMMQQEVIPGAIDGSIAHSLSNMFQQNIVSQTNPTGGVVKFEFSKEPLIVKFGERLIFYYNRTSTTGVNWEIRVNGGYEMTNDDDYELSKSLLFIGDSIMITSETRGLQYVKREDGTIFGQTPFILKNKFAELNKNPKIINLSQGGTNTPQWDDFISKGRIDILKSDIGFITLGMNDCASNTGLSTAVGVDGYFKKSLKNIIRKFFLINPNSKLVLNTITATDETTRIATISGVGVGVAGYPYNGLVRRTAYNNEIAQVASEMNALGFSNLHLCDISTAYTTAEAAFTDSPKIHANNTLGHPRIAEIIWTTISDFL